MDTAHGCSNIAVSRQDGGRSQQVRLLRHKAFTFAAALSVFCSSALILNQAIKTVEAWRDSSSLRISWTGLMGLERVRWSIDRPTPVSSPIEEQRVVPTLAQETKNPTLTSPQHTDMKRLRPKRVQTFALSTQSVLRSLAFKSQAETLRRWIFNSPTAKPTHQSVRPGLVTALNKSQKAQKQKEPRKPEEQVSIQVAKARPVASLPEGRVIAAEARKPTTPPVKEQPLVDEGENPLRSEPSVVSQDPPPVAPVDSTEVQVAAAAPSRESQLRRVSQERAGAAWISMANNGYPDILFSQGNVAIPSNLSSESLGSQYQEWSDSQRLGSKDSQRSVWQGWVSGWIPEGARIRVRSGAPIKYFSATGVETLGSEPGEKFFVAARVSEGPSVVQLLSGEDESVISAAGVPVAADRVTEVDFRHLQKTRVWGSLLDSEQPVPVGIAHAEIKLVGFSNHLAVTDENGLFDLGEIAVPTGLSLFLEARTQTGFVHRYPVYNLTKNDGLSLFYFSNNRLGRWTETLEGGVSPQSAMVVASLKHENLSGGRPAIKSFSGDRTLQPETYWLSSKDRLLDPTHRLQLESPYLQWIGVEISSSAVLAGLQSPRGRWMQSKWLPTSPGVVTVVSFEE